jgi:CDGSH-type Zn-finger protein/truncated hemoglobin YjbI
VTIAPSGRSPDLYAKIAALLGSVRALTSALEGADDESTQHVRTRLRDSVLRPLLEVSSASSESAASEAAAQKPETGRAAGELDDRLFELARTATALFAEDPDHMALAEAAAALQDLALSRAVPEVAADRLAAFQQLQSALESRIRLVANGPYLVTNATRLTDYLGQPGPLRPQLALCRCGASKLKPLCDGSHATNGFDDAKDPNRVPDRRDTYVGQQVTILDNRGVCQHAGYCTDRLATVFRTSEEPFVAPSGGRMDEIIRAVRDCPSGALSYAIDGEEARDSVDYHGSREPAIEVTKDGPYRITGGIRLVDSEGADVPRNEGASFERYALCRCGQSRNKPFCSGMHWYVDFHDPVAEPDHEPTIFEWAGGLPALTRMTRLFYEKHVPQDPLLAPVFATMSADHPERVAKWLGEVFCGPKAYSSEYGGYPRMLSQHLGKLLTEEHRTRWVALLLRSAREAGLPNDPEFRSAFSSYIEWGSRLAVENSQTGSTPPPKMPMPRWDWSTAAGPPGSRISALGGTPHAHEEHEEPAPVLPEAGQEIRFEDHIKTLFRSRDRRSMRSSFDLWEYDDVAAHADAILARVREGSMPCDGAWPSERVDAFQRWIEAGKPR